MIVRTNSFVLAALHRLYKYSQNTISTNPFFGELASMLQGFPKFLRHHQKVYMPKLVNILSIFAIPYSFGNLVSYGTR